MTHATFRSDLRTELRDYLHVAVRAAKAAGVIQQNYLGSKTDLGITTKSSDTDLVTLADGECERKIAEIVLGEYPDHAILGEEGGAQGENAAARWIVDPIDGTLNYAHGFPFYCCSIALELGGEVVVGVVFDASRDELFTATRDGGAYLNGAPITTTDETVLRSAMLSTGFAYTGDEVHENVETFGRMLTKCRSIRRPGAAALDLAYVACGRMDGFWERKLNAWDVAAGWLLVEEAGGRVSDARGRPYSLDRKILVASNGALHDDLVRALELPDEA